MPKENRKDLRDVPRRVLRALRIVLVEHVDDVLREALVVTDTSMFGNPHAPLEYRDGKLATPVVVPAVSPALQAVPAQQPGA
jgi:ATP-dependent Lon protease